MRAKPGWVRTYRALNHGRAEEACRSRDIGTLSSEIGDFTSQFVVLQEKRHEADYDPTATFYKSDVQRLIVDARTALSGLESASRQDRKSLAAFALFRGRN